MACAATVPGASSCRYATPMAGYTPSSYRGRRSKRYLAGGAKAGHFCLIGGPLDGAQTILICEGWATGASVHEAIDGITATRVSVPKFEDWNCARSRCPGRFLLWRARDAADRLPRSATAAIR